MTKKKQPNLEESFQKLAKIVEEVESGSADLETSVAKFEEGIDLAKEIKKKLSSLEAQVVTLSKDLEDDSN